MLRKESERRTNFEFDLSLILSLSLSPYKSLLITTHFAIMFVDINLTSNYDTTTNLPVVAVKSD